MLQSALDADPEDLHPDARKFVDGVRQYGWIITHVYASDTSPSFSYTTGLCVARTLPEFIVFGLGMNVAHGLLDNLIDKFVSGVEVPTELPIPDLFEGVDVFLFPTAPKKHAEWMLRTAWFYDTSDFPCQQLVFPDNEGRFPWDEDVDPLFEHLQPDLTGTNWVSRLRQRLTANDI